MSESYSREEVVETILNWIDQNKLEEGDLFRSGDIAEDTEYSSRTIGPNIRYAFEQHDEYNVKYHGGESKQNIWAITTDEMDNINTVRLYESPFINALSRHKALKMLSYLTTEEAISRETIAEDLDIQEASIIVTMNKLTSHQLVYSQRINGESFYKLTEKGSNMKKDLMKYSNRFKENIIL